MQTIRLRADDSETLLGQVPSSWAEVPLAAYARLAGAEGLTDRIAALAALVGLPTAPLLDTPELAGDRRWRPGFLPAPCPRPASPYLASPTWA